MAHQLSAVTYPDLTYKTYTRNPALPNLNRPSIFDVNKRRSGVKN